MMRNSLLIVLLVCSSCGKIEKVQDSFVALSSNNDLRMVELRMGAAYRNDPATQPGGYDFIEYENTQYRLGEMSSEVASAFANIPRGQVTQVYFKGKFVKRQGLSASAPEVVFDVIELDAISPR